MRRLLCHLSPLCLLGAVAPLSAQTAADTAAIQREVVTYLAAQKAYHTTGTITAVCLSLGTPRPPVRGVQIPLIRFVDPGSALLKALAGVKPPIVPGTRCHADPARKMAIVDSASRPRRTAIAIIVSPVRITADGRKASLLVDRAFDVMTARGHLCTLNRSGTAWKVESCEITWGT